THLQRMLAALELTGAGDDRQLAVIGDLDVADAHGAGVAHTSLDCSTAAFTKLVNSGCGWNGFDLSSGWYCTQLNQGCSGISMISGSVPSGDMPEKRMPFASSRSI